MSTKAPNDSTRLDALLTNALVHTKFAPGSYTFDAMRAVALAVEARREADWISEFAAWNDCGTGDVLAGPLEKPHPALAD